MQGLLQLSQKTSRELNEIASLISTVGITLDNAHYSQRYEQTLPVPKMANAQKVSLANLEAQIRSLEASVTNAKQNVMSRVISSKITENVTELAETIESAKYRFIYMSGERMRNVMQKIPDLTSLYSMILAEPSVFDDTAKALSLLTKTRTNEELDSIRDIVKETEAKISALQESIGDSLKQIMSDNLYIELGQKIASACERDIWGQIMKKNAFLKSVNTLYQAGRKLVTMRNNNLSAWEDAASSITLEKSDESRSIDKHVLGSPLFKDYSTEILRRYQDSFAEQSRQYILLSETYFHLSLYTKLFTAHLLTLMEQERLSSIVTLTFNSINNQVCAAMRGFMNKMSEFSSNELLHLFNIYLGCAQLAIESTTHKYSRAKTAFDELFSSLSLTVGSVGHQALTIDTMLQVFNAKYHIATIISGLQLTPKATNDFRGVSKGLEQAHTLLMQQYIAFIYTHYTQDINESTIAQTFLFCNKDNMCEAAHSADSSLLDGHRLPDISQPNVELANDIHALFVRVKTALTKAVCHRYSKTFTATENDRLEQLLATGVFLDDKTKTDIIINMETCLRILMHKDDYFLNSLISVQDLSDQLNIEQSYLSSQAVSLKKRLSEVEREIKREVPSVGTSKSVLSHFYQEFMAWEDSFKSAHMLYMYSSLADISVYVHNYLLDSVAEHLDIKSAQGDAQVHHSKYGQYKHAGYHSAITTHYFELEDVLNQIDMLLESKHARALFAPDERKQLDEVYNYLEDEVQGTTSFTTSCVADIDRALLHIPLLEDMIAPERAALGQNERSISTSLMESCVDKSLFQSVRDSDIPKMIDDAQLAPLLDIPVLNKKLFTEMEDNAATCLSVGAKGLSAVLSGSQARLSEVQCKHDQELLAEKQESMAHVSKYVTNITEAAKELDLSARGSTPESVLPLQQINLLLGDAISISRASIEHSSGGKHILGESLGPALSLLS